MKTLKSTLLTAFFFLLLIGGAAAQLTMFGFTAGTPEDQASDAISKENDPQKKIALLTDFVQKFSGNSVAVAYGNWQLALLYQAAGDLKAAMAAGDKALAAEPHAMEIAVAMTQVAQQAKDNVKVVDYAVAGANAFHGIAAQPKGSMPAEEFADRVKREEDAARDNYQVLEIAAYNGILGIDDPKARMKAIEQFTPAFPNSQFGEQVAQYALLSLNQMGDSAGLEAYSEKAIAANPKSAATMVLLASAFADDPKAPKLDKSLGYARRAIELATADKNLDPAKRDLYIGVAKTTIGHVLLIQEKTVAAIPELKSAAALVKSDPTNYSTTLYFLAFAYAKANRLAEAKAVLADAVNVPGPAQELSRKLLAQINGAKPAVRRTK
jgi:tetratricopeptide (TPR) repeat protein